MKEKQVEKKTEGAQRQNAEELVRSRMMRR
jgi:hypothetical protein